MPGLRGCGFDTLEGTTKATTADEAVVQAAKEHGFDARRLIAVGRR